MAEENIVVEVTEQAQEPATKPNERKFSKQGSKPRNRRDNKAEKVSDGIDKKMVNVNRISKTVKGGRKMRFNAIVVAGDRNGRVGVGMGKATEVTIAIEKASVDAKRHMVKIDISGTTIPHEVIGEFGAGRVLLKPAAEGTGVIAGGPARAVLELAGIRDIRTKCLRSNNPRNVVSATIEGLKSLMSLKEVADKRGKTPAEIVK